MTLTDGKLITLTNSVTVAADRQNVDPLDKLPYYFSIPPTGDLTRGGTATHAETQVIRRGTVSQFGGPDLEEHSWQGEWLVPDWYNDGNDGNNPGADKGQLILDADGNVIQLGNGNIARTPKADHDPYAWFPSYFLRPPKGYNYYGALVSYQILSKIRDLGLVVNLRIQDLSTGILETNMPVTIRRLEITEKPGEPDTRYYNITLRQYRWMQIRYVNRVGDDGSGGYVRPTMGRFIASPYKTSKAYNIDDFSQLAYHDRTKGAAIIAANGGAAKMIKEKKLIDLLATGKPGTGGIVPIRGGRYTIPKGVSIVIPPITPPGGIGVVPPGTAAPMGS